MAFEIPARDHVLKISSMGLVVLLLAGMLITSGALAQNTAHPPLKFATDPKEVIGSFGGLSNAVFKPKGDGPFPAVVLVHSCAGVHDHHMRVHARELLAAGMVVLVQDSFTPRGAPNCGPNNAQALHIMVGAADAYAGLAHLRIYPFVEKERIFMAGYSWGGEIASLLASPGVAQKLAATHRFRASVANYSPCKTARRTLVSDATDRPLLLLLGEKDDETPASTCFPLVEEYKVKGLPIQWHVYPGATHGWDKPGQAKNGYFYNAEVAADATRRMVDFFKAN